MPLETQIRRNNRTLKVQWDFPHLSCMLTAALKEGDPDFLNNLLTDPPLEEGVYVDFSWAPIYYFNTKCKLWTEGKQILKQTHTFQLSGNELFELKRGDLLRMHRSHK